MGTSSQAYIFPLTTSLGMALVASMLTGCAAISAQRPSQPVVERHARFFVDQTRDRLIPSLLYGRTDRHRPLAVLLPGYGNGHDEYSFIADELVRRGYLVAAVQPQKAEDPPVPGGDNLVIRRRPYWLRGALDVRHVIRTLVAEGAVKMRHVIIVGHSHGGDIAMLFATLYPGEVSRVMSLDNRRMPIPRITNPRICSARSSDMPADQGVLPSEHDEHRFKMAIVSLPAVKHDEMFDGAAPQQKAAMLAALDLCLRRV